MKLQDQYSLKNTKQLDAIIVLAPPIFKPIQDTSST